MMALDRCAGCGVPTACIDHPFFEGVAPFSRTRGERPAREWTIRAPLYFRSNADNTAAIEGYCGPKCALARMGT
jgi:hypothetical protein